jgi:hypothetical protein
LRQRGTVCERMKGTRVDGGRHEDGESEGVFAVKRCHGFDCSAAEE